MTRKLTLADISDLRAYEREREDFRARVIAEKKKRRIGVGEFITFVFENRTTVRYQIQEMARVERIISDEGIEEELRTYNPLIPEPGQLSASMFIELTTKGDLMHWLPKLVGIERSAALVIGDGDAAHRIPCVPEEAHEAQLTRDEVTSSVHYIRFELSPEQVDAFERGPVRLTIDHPAYSDAVQLGPETVSTLVSDLRAD